MSVLPELRHSHKAGWGAPESYSFAESVVREGKPWIREMRESKSDQIVSAEFETKRRIDRAVIVITLDSGYTGSRQWKIMPADLQQTDGRVRITARLPAGARAYFFNLQSKEGVTSSEYAEVSF